MSAVNEEIVESAVPGKSFGVQLAKTWHWYEKWVEEVRNHCQQGDYNA